MNSRYKPVGWRGESHRHYLAAKYGSSAGPNKYKAHKYMAYTPTYVAGDLPLIAGDAVGTTGAAAVSLIPVVVPLALLYGGAKLAKKHKDKTGHWYLAERQYNSGYPSYYNSPQADPHCIPELKHGTDPDVNFDPKQLAAGIKVEMEHTNNPAIAKQIAKAHLNELPDYYDRLAVIEQEPAGKQLTVKGIPIKADKVEKGRIYPVDPQDVAKELNRQKPEDVKGIKSVEFVNPKGDQNDAWAQYLRGRKTVYVFSQPYKHGKIDGQNPKLIRDHIKEYVLPHEIGHHVALRNGKTDKDIRVAEARADAHVVGMSPTDKDIKRLI